MCPGVHLHMAVMAAGVPGMRGLEMSAAVTGCYIFPPKRRFCTKSMASSRAAAAGPWSAAS